MATLTKGKTFANGELVTPQKLHELVDLGTVTGIVNADISASAAIADTKLATISTAGKVSNSATTATSANTANALVARDATGNFSAGTITAALSGNASSATTSAACSGNAATATKLATARTITLGGDLSGSVSFDGSANATLTAAVADDSHNHVISNIDGLQTALDGKQAAGSYAPATGIAPSAITGTAVITTDSRLSDSRTPTAHTHGNITNAGAIGATANLPVVTTTSGVLTTIPAGSAGQVLTSNGGTSAPSFQTLAATSTNANNLTGGSAGTVPYQSAAGTTAMLAAGTSGQVLRSNGAAAPSWLTLAPSATTDTTNAANISAGTLPLARIPTGTTATSVCIGNDARLSDARTPTAHTHGNITSAGAIGTTSGVPVITGTSGVLQTGSFGTTAGTFCQGNDSRLSNSRFPTYHTHDADQITSGTLSNDRLNATSANAVNNLVLRDANGDFSARTITASSFRARGGEPGSGGILNNGFSFATPGDNDSGMFSIADGQIQFFVNSTEATRLNNTDILIGTKNPIDPASGTNDGVLISHFDPRIIVSRNNLPSIECRRRSSNGEIVNFYKDTTKVGNISVTATSTAYNTSSDYRLKTNLEPLTDAVARLLQIPVHRFNWVADPDAPKVDGFLAHEAQAVVPESVTGHKDEVDAEGNPVHQGIDQSKLVPLLVAAVQELAARVAALESAK